MTANFSTFGSCCSRNIFNSSLNNDYKKYFTVSRCVETVTMIGLMANPIEFDEKLLDSDMRYDNLCISDDLSKAYRFFFIQNDSQVEYLIFDTFFDTEYTIIKIDDNTFISDSRRLRKTSMHKQFDGYPRLNIYNDFDEYIVLWKDVCNRFFDFLSENRPDIKIILNCARPVYRYEEDGRIAESPKLKRNCKDERVRNLLDRYIIDNFDVDILSFDYDTLALKDHIFGFHQPIMNQGIIAIKPFN